MTTSFAATASAGLCARVAPRDTRSSAREAVRFQTVTAKPRSSKAAAIARPMGPSPMTVTAFCALFIATSNRWVRAESQTSGPD